MADDAGQGDGVTAHVRLAEEPVGRPGRPTQGEDPVVPVLHLLGAEGREGRLLVAYLQQVTEPEKTACRRGSWSSSSASVSASSTARLMRRLIRLVTIAGIRPTLHQVALPRATRHMTLQLGPSVTTRPWWA